MTDADRLREYLEKLGLSQRAFSREIEFDDRLVRYWCSGKEPVPRGVWLALERFEQLQNSAWEKPWIATNAGRDR